MLLQVLFWLDDGVGGGGGETLLQVRLWLDDSVGSSGGERLLGVQLWLGDGDMQQRRRDAPPSAEGLVMA